MLWHKFFMHKQFLFYYKKPISSCAKYRGFIELHKETSCARNDRARVLIKKVFMNKTCMGHLCRTSKDFIQKSKAL